MAAKQLTTNPAPAPLPSLPTALSRRRALFGAAVLAAAPAAAGAALAAPSETSPLATQLGAEFRRLAGDLGAAGKRMDAAEELLKLPKTPSVLLVRDGDLSIFRWHFPNRVDGRRGAPCWWGDRIESLRADDYAQNDGKLDRMAAARRDEIVTAYDKWRAAQEEAEASCGLTAARDEWLDAAERYEAFRINLVHLQTRDPAVMAVKASVIAERYDAAIEEAITDALGRQQDIEALSFSLARDIAQQGKSETA